MNPLADQPRGKARALQEASRPRDIARGLLWVSPWIVGGTAFLLLPMAMSLYYSLTDYPILKPPVFVGVDNYTSMLGDARFWHTVRNTGLFGVIFVPLSTLLALVLAALLSARSRGGSARAGGSGGALRFAKLYRGAIFVPTLVPLVATAMIWTWLFNGEYGLINQLLKLVGVQGPNWLVDARWAIPALVVASLWGVGQQVVVYVAALQDVPRYLYEAAELDGMGPVRRFRNVTVPMISPSILFNVVTLTINTLQVFAVPYILFRNERGQAEAGDFFNLYLFDNAFVYQRMGYASAMAWVQLVIVLLLTWVMFAASKRLVHYRA